VTAYPVEHVVDPVGAGGAFDAGFIAGVLRGYRLESGLHVWSSRKEYSLSIETTSAILLAGKTAAKSSNRFN